MKAVILAVCFAAAISLPFLRSQISLGVAKSVLVERYKLATEHYLQKSDVLGTLEQEAMQAAIIYLVEPRLSYTIRFANAPQIPICRCEISRSSSVFVAALMRNAQIAGFGRDDAGMTSDSLAGHLRRHLWCQLCFLDLRTAEAQGHLPSTRSSQLDMELPLNLDNDKIATTPYDSAPSRHKWIDSAFSLIRYECYEVH